MDERVVKFRVGVMVLSTLIIAGILDLVVRRCPLAGAGEVHAPPAFRRRPGRHRRYSRAQKRHSHRPGREGQVRRKGGVIVDCKNRWQRQALPQRSAASEGIAAGRRRGHSIRHRAQARRENPPRRGLWTGGSAGLRLSVLTADTGAETAPVGTAPPPPRRKPQRVECTTATISRVPLPPMLSR